MSDQADSAFDLLLAPQWFEQSLLHWTPREVCHQAARLLDLRPGARVLDVGSGVGKFCILASEVSPAEFVGVEQRPHLVDEARRIAARVGSAARFILGDALALDWRAFDALYFYNPFDELRFSETMRIDPTLVFGDEVFWRLARGTAHRLEGLAAGTKVVTYHGFGLPMSASFRRVERADALCLYVKETEA